METNPNLYGTPQALPTAPGDIETTAYIGPQSVTLEQGDPENGIPARRVYLSPAQIRALSAALPPAEAEA